MRYRVQKLFNVKIITQNIGNLRYIIVLYLLFAAGTFLHFLQILVVYGIVQGQYIPMLYTLP